jgi:hypothetical protein
MFLFEGKSYKMFFWGMANTNTGKFVQHSICCRKAAAKLYLAMVVTTPSQLLLKLMWVNRKFTSYDYMYSWENKKYADCKLRKIIRLGGCLNTFQQCQLLRIAAAIRDFGNVLAKNKSWKDI